MDIPFFKRLRGFFSTPSHSRTVSFLAILVIAAAVPLTVFVAQRQQNINQHASTSTTPIAGNPCTKGAPSVCSSTTSLIIECLPSTIVNGVYGNYVWKLHNIACNTGYESTCVTSSTGAKLECLTQCTNTQAGICVPNSSCIPGNGIASTKCSSTTQTCCDSVGAIPLAPTVSTFCSSITPKVKISWATYPGAASYNMRRWHYVNGSWGNYTEVDGLTTTSYTFTPATPGALYRAQVQINVKSYKTGWSPYSTSVKSVSSCIAATATPKPTTKPTATPTTKPTASPTPRPTVTLTPTPRPTATPTVNPTLTVTPTVNPTVTLTLTPTVNPTLTLTPTPTIGGTSLSFVVGLDAIGNTGTNSNAAFAFSNKSPVHTSQNVSVEVIDAGNIVVGQGTGVLSYVPATPTSATAGKFTGTVAITGNLPQGQYRVKIAIGGHLKKLIPGVWNLTPGLNVMSSVNVVAGDFNNDNALTILDYNIWLSCSIYATTAQAANCTSALRILSDINDNGTVDQIDYNYFLNEFAVQNGD